MKKWANSKLVKKIERDIALKMLKKRCFRKNAVGIVINYMDYGLDFDEMMCLFPPTPEDIYEQHKELLKVFTPKDI